MQQAVQGEDVILRSSRRGVILQEFFTNTFHFPAVLILLELIPEGWRFFTEDPAIYALIAASLLQAYFLGSWQYDGKPRPFLGNLIAPGLYTIVEILLEGPEFFSESRHLAYWGFALAIGLIQEVRLRIGGNLGRGLVLLENTVRTSILLIGYWIFEIATHSEAKTLTGFLSDDSHVFVALAVVLIGLIVGFANLNAEAYLNSLHRTAARLRQYSEWLLGRQLLSQIMADPEALSLQRQQRAVLFIDIRGFTRWSEAQAPEAVVGMLNRYFEVGERIWTRHQAIKAKPSADEIMVVFSNVMDAVQASRELCHEVGELLAAFGLTAGVGLHYGQLVEGLLGSKDVKGYDVIGDAVNTAKRICDHAVGGEVLISQAVLDELAGQVHVLAKRQVTAKGKESPLDVYALCAA
ncbi:MAG: adenylate/guanylate cyclase domain-containing protein [Chloroflexota bacterium]